MPDEVLVFGAGGFVGRHLVTTLASHGIPVIALVRRPPEKLLPAVETVTGKFDTAAQLAPLLSRARAVIHAASRSTPGQTAGMPNAELDANLRPTLALLETLQSAPHCELLYLSSGGTLYGETNNRPATERDSIRPSSYYGAGKAAAEHFIHAFCMQFQRSAVILRPSNLYGPGQNRRSGFGIIPTALDCVKSQIPLTVWGDGTSVRDYLYIDDFIQLCLAILSRPIPAGAHIFNASSGVGVSLNSLIDEIRDVTGATLNIVHDTGRTVDINRVVLDPSLVSQEYDWLPRTSLRRGLELTWQWWIQQT